VRALASRIVRGLELELTMNVLFRDEAVIVEFGGPDARFLLDNEGEGVEAIQHLLNRVLSRDREFDRRVLVDCNGFRGRHDRELVERATRAAEEVRKEGRPVHFDGLNPYERRLIHVALSEDRTVRTYSTGEGSEKRLIIAAAAGGDPPAGEM